MGSSLEGINHLQFVDDTILLSSSRWENVVVMKRILRCYELVSGLKIILGKNMVVGVACLSEVVLSLASKLMLVSCLSLI